MWKTVMWPAMMAVLVTFNEQPHAKELAAGQGKDTPDFLDNLANMLVDKLVDKLVEAHDQDTMDKFVNNRLVNKLIRYRCGKKDEEKKRIILGREYMILGNTGIPGAEMERLDMPLKIRKGPPAGSIVIMLQGPYRGKRVVVLKKLSSKTNKYGDTYPHEILITGPAKINGVPVQKVELQYLRPTGTKVDIDGVVDDDTLIGKIEEVPYMVEYLKAPWSVTRDGIKEVHWRKCPVSVVTDSGLDNRQDLTIDDERHPMGGLPAPHLQTLPPSVMEQAMNHPIPGDPARR